MDQQVEINKREPVLHEMTDKEIIQIVTRENDPDLTEDANEEDEEQLTQNPTAQEAISRLEVVIVIRGCCYSAHQTSPVSVDLIYTFTIKNMVT